MSAAVEGSNTIIDPEAEVRKLQELVKKLERQNQLLRSKQGPHLNNRTVQPSPLPGQDSTNTPVEPVVHTSNMPPAQQETQNSDLRNDKLVQQSANKVDNIKSERADVTLDDIDIVDVDKSLTEDNEENWLYSFPNKSPGDGSISPYKWARQEFDHPSPELDVARKSLFNKLEEVTRSPSRSPSSGTLASLTSPGTNYSSTPTGSTKEFTQGMPSLKKSLVLGTNSKIDTSTFTRPKKNKEKPSDLRSSSSSQRDEVDSSRESLGSQSQPAEVENRTTQPPRLPASQPAEPSTETHKYSNMMDVKNLAKMQEESLRQSLNSPHMSPRKSGLRAPRQTHVPSAGNLDHENSPSSHGSARSSPGRFDSDAYQATRRSNNSLTSASSHSSSSPPDSPYASQYLDQRQDNVRRSLPNLNRSGLSLPRGYENSPSPPRTSSGLRMPSSATRAVSPGRAMSPARSGIPTPRTGIPRPSSSKLPTPRKSGIPSRSRPNRQVDDSWKDGCY